MVAYDLLGLEGWHEQMVRALKFHVVGIHVIVEQGYPNSFLGVTA